MATYHDHDNALWVPYNVLMNSANISSSQEEGLYSMKSVKTGFHLPIANIPSFHSTGIPALFLSCRCSMESAWNIKAISRAFLLFRPLEKA
jgi:hypothetical protein